MDIQYQFVYAKWFALQGTSYQRELKGLDGELIDHRGYFLHHGYHLSAFRDWQTKFCIPARGYPKFRRRLKVKY